MKIVKDGYRNLVACFTSARAVEPHQVSKIRARDESVEFFGWDHGPCDLHDHKRTPQPVRLENGRPTTPCLRHRSSFQCFRTGRSEVKFEDFLEDASNFVFDGIKDQFLPS